MSVEFWNTVLPIFTGVIIGGTLVWALWSWIHIRYFSPQGCARRTLRRTKPLPIAQAIDGQVVKVVGELRCEGELLRAPLTRRRCVYYHVTVELEKSTPGSRNFHWETIVDEKDCCPTVALDDGTGFALVDLVHPEVVAKDEIQFDSKFIETATESAKIFLERHGVPRWKTLRLTEEALEPGKEVAVFGLCRLEPNPDPQAGGGGGEGYRDLQTPTRLRIVAPEGKLLISDKPSVL